MKTKRAVIIVIVYSIILSTICCTVTNFKIQSTQTIPSVSFSEFIGRPGECTAVIVTGRAAEGGKALFMKNRDLPSDPLNEPIQVEATEETFAYVAVNLMSMGINEKGLSLGNTYMPALAESEFAGMMNGHLNQYLLLHCETVSEVVESLQDDNSPVGPSGRMVNYSVATCIGVIDSTGVGAFIEISNSLISVEYVVNSYQSRANHPRTYPGLADDPYGRDQYALDACEAIMQEKGEISGKDLAQRVSRYVRDKEINSTRFTIWGEVCNDNTVAAMVAISGDERYGGKLNIMWGEYGTVPLVGVFLPAMACSGKPPGILGDIFDETLEKKEYAKTSIEDLYSSFRVREIQQYAFAAENFSFNEYANLLANIPDGLNETEILITLHEFVKHLTSIIADMYINESSSLPEYAEPFSIKFEPQLTQTTATSPFINETTTTTTNPSPTYNAELEPIVIIVIAGLAGLSIPLVGYYLIFYRLKKYN